MTQVAKAHTREIPSRTEVLIIGGGIIGCSIAYHLTRRGITDVTVIEQGALTGGTTWHAAGLVSQLKSSHSLTKLATYSSRLFEELEDETGQATGYRTPGSISVASDDERWEEILRGASMATACDVDTEVISLDRAKELFPLLYTDDLVGWSRSTARSSEPKLKVATSRPKRLCWPAASGHASSLQPSA